MKDFAVNIPGSIPYQLRNGNFQEKGSWIGVVAIRGALLLLGGLANLLKYSLKSMRWFTNAAFICSRKGVVGGWFLLRAAPHFAPVIVKVAFAFGALAVIYYAVGVWSESYGFYANMK